MDREKRRTIFFASILGLIFVVAVVYLLFGSLINRGSLSVIAKPPFVVEIFGGEQFECTNSPCKITSKNGSTEIIFAKEGHKSIVQTVDIPRWRTADLTLNFELIPFIQTTDEMPLEEEIIYEIVLDENEQIYKLIDSADPRQKALVFFPQAIENPQIFSSKNAALIVESATSAYKIDLLKKEKQRIDNINFTNIAAGKWSPNGQFFAFNNNNSSQVNLLTANNNLLTTSITGDLSQMAWTEQNELIYVSQTFSFLAYDPTKNSATSLGNFPAINEIPTKIIPATNGKIIYFQTSQGAFKLNL